MLVRLAAAQSETHFPFLVMASPSASLANPFENAFTELIQALEALPFPYCLVGALALGVWGIPRTTQDLDILISVGERDRSCLLEALRSRDFVPDDRWAEENPLIRAWHLRFRRGPIPVDLMLPRDRHDESALTRRSRQALDRLALWVIAPEDFILHKLKAGRAQDFVDVLSVLHRQRDSLDTTYLNSWAQQLRIQDELTYCWNQLPSA